MKNRILIVALAVFSVLSFSSCKKDTDVTNLLGKMSAKIDGVAWSVSTTDLSGFGAVGAVDKDGKFVITGTATDGKTIVLVVNGNTAGTYDLSPLEGEATAGSLYRITADENESDNYYSTKGSVTVSEVTDKRISGTFNFTGVKSVSETVNVTDGVFDNLMYTVSTSEK